MSDAERTESGYGFGTFKGVFTPSLLTILDGLPPTGLVTAGEDVDLHALFASA